MTYGITVLLSSEFVILEVDEATGNLSAYVNCLITQISEIASFRPSFIP